MRNYPKCPTHQIHLRPVFVPGELKWKCVLCTPPLAEMEIVNTPRGVKTRRVKGRCRPCEAARRRETLAKQYDSSPL